MTVEITEQDFYEMRAKRDKALTAVIQARIEVGQLIQALTEANALYNTVEAINLDLTERVEAMQADAKLSDMAWKDNQAALKAQAETIARLTAELAQCKHEEELLRTAARLLYDVENFGADDSGRRKSISAWLNNYQEAAK